MKSRTCWLSRCRLQDILYEKSHGLYRIVLVIYFPMYLCTRDKTPQSNFEKVAKSLGALYLYTTGAVVVPNSSRCNWQSILQLHFYRRLENKFAIYILSKDSSCRLRVPGGNLAFLCKVQVLHGETAYAYTTF